MYGPRSPNQQLTPTLQVSSPSSLDDHERRFNSRRKRSRTRCSVVWWTAGDGAAAAAEHYRNEHFLHETLIEAMRFVSGGYARLGENFRTIKRRMREANDEAHHEIEQTLRANNNQPVGVGPILTKYRTLINEYSIELRGIVGDETTMLTNEFQAVAAEWSRRWVRRCDRR